jgi:peptidyl-tRNA hydrolase, PTH1 family
MASTIPAIATKLIVGLGNPGAEYEATRHNAGFWFADAIADELKTSFNKEQKFAGWFAKAKFKGNDVLILKPNTYMNRSGQSVQAVANFYKVNANEILVIHDELDMMPGSIKMKFGGGTGGHNGLKDIQSKIGTPDYWRVRVGIGHPRTLGLQQEVADFVLHPARFEEQDAINTTLPRLLKVLPNLLAGEIDDAVRLLHTAP